MTNFLTDQEWDAPFFKRLAPNDTGRAPGHQGGMVLPKELRKFLPQLDESATSRSAPTTDRYLHAEMFLGTSHLTDGAVRYQLQTWGASRRAESRITEGLAPLRGRAVAGDILLFQRHAEELDRFRLTLVPLGTHEFAEVERSAQGRRWGALFTDIPPVTQNQLMQAEHEIVSLSERPFVVLRPEVPRLDTRQSRIARSAAFRQRVSMEYDAKCAISGNAVASPTLSSEVESAHVVPLSRGGTDDIRNGLTLMRTLHWAFDQGLIGVRSDRTVYLPSCVRSMTGNAFLHEFENRRIQEAKSTPLRAHAGAFQWHLENVVARWD